MELDPERARAVATEAIQAAADVSNAAPDLIYVALEMLVKAAWSRSCPASPLNTLASQIRCRVNNSLFEQIVAHPRRADQRWTTFGDVAPAPKTAHQLKVTIDGIRPPIWRRALVPSDISLACLHRVIQELFGWWDYHLHEYTIDGVRYGIDDGEGWGDPPVDERRTKLATVAPKGSRFRYLYDFGDSWEHRIDVEDVVPLEAKTTYPRCLAGRRARPPEDVGGVWGYGEFLRVIADPNDEEHERMVEWAGGDFDPERCDPLDINASLTAIRK